MTLEDAIKFLKQYQGYEPMFLDGEKLKHAFDLTPGRRKAETRI